MTAHCVVTRRPDGTARCAVHAREAPCPDDGRPADPDPVHDDDRFGRVMAVSRWVTRTARQRPLAIHRGSLDCARPRHAVLPAQGPCWCHPETIPADGAG